MLLGSRARIYTPARLPGTASCAGAFRSKCLCPPLLPFDPTHPRNPLVEREPLSIGPRHRGSHRQEGGDGGGAGRGHSPPRARLPWIRNISAATSQVGQVLGGQGLGGGAVIQWGLASHPRGVGEGGPGDVPSPDLVRCGLWSGARRARRPAAARKLEPWRGDSRPRAVFWIGKFLAETGKPLHILSASMCKVLGKVSPVTEFFFFPSCSCESCENSRERFSRGCGIFPRPFTRRWGWFNLACNRGFPVKCRTLVWVV